jgi:Uma2 family endonuclease
MRNKLNLGPLTVEEFLRIEDDAERRHEYVGGHLFRVEATTTRHNAIIRNVTARLHAAASGGPCSVYFCDILVRADTTRIYYPDVVVACTPHAGDTVMFDEACLVFEVTSRSTRRTDRGEKLDAYLTMPSLRGYIVIEQTRRHMTAYLRDDAGEWRREEAMAAGSIQLPCLDVPLTLADVYEGVDLPPLRVREGDIDAERAWIEMIDLEGEEHDPLEDLFPEEYEIY